jgi:methionine-rich copper-binding protein CopC
MIPRSSVAQRIGFAQRPERWLGASAPIDSEMSRRSSLAQSQSQARPSCCTGAAWFSQQTVRSVALAASIVVGLFGHAPIQAAEPAPNSNLARAPARVAILMGDEGIGNGLQDYVRVFDSRGLPVAEPHKVEPRGSSTVLTAPVNVRRPGWYVVHWNVQSSDGHLAAGDSGGWWAFGYKGSTPRVATPTVLTLAPTDGTSRHLRATLNGRKTGVRSLTFAKFTGTIVSLRWKLISKKVDATAEPTLEWNVRSNPRQGTAVATGIIPIIGTYRVNVVKRSRVGTTTRLVVHEATVTIS